MFQAAFASLSASKPHAGQECSRTHNGLSVLTPQDAHSFVVSSESIAANSQCLSPSFSLCVLSTAINVGEILCGSL